jgi:hypothetical protein
MLPVQLTLSIDVGSLVFALRSKYLEFGTITVEGQSF